MMSTMFYVVCIVAIVFTAITAEQYMKLRMKKNQGGKIAEETQEQLDKLEERIQVLERIITENRFDLRQEIDKL